LARQSSYLDVLRIEAGALAGVTQAFADSAAFAEMIGRLFDRGGRFVTLSIRGSFLSLSGANGLRLTLDWCPYAYLPSPCSFH
jgi:hypothetical protein